MENLIKYVNYKNKQLLNCDFTFKYLFDVIHDQEDRIFGEYLDNYQINNVTYKEMRSYSLKMASFLKKEISDEIDNYVGLFLENSITWVSCFWGLLLAGYKVALLNSKLPLEITNNVIKSLDIKTIVSNVNKFSDKKIIHLDQTNKFISEVNECKELEDIKCANEIAICSTATSLNYKICIFTAEDLTYQVLNAKKIIKTNNMVKAHYEGRLKVLAFLPFYHIFGLVAAYLWFSIFGRTFVFLKDYAPDSIINTIKRHSVTHIFAVPLLWNTITKEINKGLESRDEKTKEKATKWFKRSIAIQNVFPKLGMKFARHIYKEIIDKTLGNSIKFLITGGGPVAEDTMNLINAIGYPLFNGYGSSEIGITSVELRKRVKCRLSSSVGKPFASVNYKIEDAILFVRGKSTCSKIITKDNDVKIVNKDEWYKTNDIAHIDRGGNYYIDGRLDDVYVSPTGEKYNPDNIEKKCLFNNVNNYSIIKMDKYLALIIQISEDTNALMRIKIKDEVENQVNMLRKEGYPLHKIYYTYDKMMNANAIKVSRTILTNNINNGIIQLIPFAKICAEEVKDDLLENKIVKEVAKVFGEVLGIDEAKIGIDQHFIYDLGGSSLDYLCLLVKLKNIYGIDFNFEDYTVASVKEVAKYIIRKNK